ncbi:glycosyltransferase family 61 protein [Spirosoma sp. KCTC 42546]|uniref:glycosyltransferase family 61 protein n=1 Tax=Spirosoma sp. KCTC 42546 TaxID=2520506 RepID=UPI00115A70E2|nr:glycosyltransferase family 61 protein [Spirosoma sp. KCTC 42546]QDK79359.1 glycosyltransferase family 61 protein [Spirosoma sp. KCTC 42546]
MGRLRDLIKTFLGSILKRFGIIQLTKEQTEEYLKPYVLKVSPATRIVLPSVQNETNSAALVFTPTKAITHPGYVWNVTPSSQKTTQLPYGGILTDTRVLCTDFERYHLLKNFLTRRKRIQTVQDILIAPWSHLLDGISFGGYYDFVILVAAKLCRIREALPEAVFAQAVLAYPLFKTAYEQEYLALLGFEKERILDSTVYEVHFKQCILANSGHWFYPNPADIFALKKQVESKLNLQRTESNRIYISRSGRRKVANENALITLLKKFNFTVVEDKPRSVAEQAAIYKNASFILGPHGASFTNIIWCEPGTHLFELFAADMVVDHFRYLSQLMDMHYSAYYHGIKMGNSRISLEEDVFVSIADLDLSLRTLFNQG